MKLGSLFDGSGGFPLAGSLCGFDPVWASEVEPYPIAVTTSRFPHMKHLGDVSKINGAEIEPVDIITFGSPCQDMSVAGKRAGIKHEDNGDDETTRSGLFIEAVRIIKEMRNGTEGRFPTFVVWENVPGAFSSNRGQDFRTVLDEFIKIAEPTAVMPDVPKGGWAYADCYSGDGWSLAYRVFDAQYIRTAQRRKRIYLVLDLGGQRARKILFERDRLRGHYPQSGKAWEATASSFEGSLDADDREGAQTGVVIDRHILDDQGGSQISVRDDGKCPTLRAEVHGNVPCVIEPAIPIHDQAKRFSGKRGDHLDVKGNGLGVGNQGDPANTLTSGDRHAVAYQENVGALCARDYKGIGSQYVNESKCIVVKEPSEVAYGIGNGQADQTALHEIPGALNCMHDQQAVLIKHTDRYIVRRLTPTECARLQGFPDRWGDINHKNTMTDEDYGFWLEVRQTFDRINGRAKKYYTEKQILAWYNKLYNDGAEYKMWGNGIALPCALYVMEGIVEVAT